MSERSGPLDEREEPPELPRSAALSEYLVTVIEDTEHLAFGNPQGLGQADRLRLRDVWIPPNVIIRDAGNAGDSASPRQRRLLEDERPIQVDAALNMKIFHRSALTGPPGYGKSTLCARLAYKHAFEANQEGRGWIPLRVPLRVVNQRGVWSSFAELLYRLPNTQNGELRTVLAEAHARGQLWVFLDGLDEVSIELLTPLRQRLEAGVLSSANRTTVTCRTADYWNARPMRRLAGLPVLDLSGFSEEQLDLYVENWHSHAAVGRPQQVRRRVAHTKRLLDAHDDLRELAESPLLAAVLCVVESRPRAAELGRAALLRLAIDYLLTFPEWRRSEPHEPERYIDGDVLHRIAYRLAFEMFDDSTAVSIKRADLRSFIKDQLKQHGIISEEDDDDDMDEAVAAYFDRLAGSGSAGLMQERETGWYGFAHRAFQEYLAAHFLIRYATFSRRLELASAPEWREVFSHSASIVQFSGQGTGDLLSMIRSLLRNADRNLRRPRDSDEVERFTESACLAAEMLADFGKKAAREYGLAEALSGTSDIRTNELSFAGLWPYAVQTVLRLAATLDAPRPLRMRALSAVSRIGDPRVSADPGHIAQRLIAIPGGRGRVGTNEPLTIGELKKVPSSPPLNVTLRPFKMARFPVTNLEYEAFVAAGGYQDPRWWTGPESGRWQAKDPALLRELVELWENQKELNFVKEFSEPEFAAYATDNSARIAKRTMDRDLPLYWHDSRFNLPTAPVVGVNLWEAQAYCRWLDHTLHELGLIETREEVGIPTEIEWEWAAGREWSGLKRNYPWGTDFDPDECLVRDFSQTDPEIIHFGAIPVGFAGLGRTPDGPEDLAGNVWEWVSSLNYPWDDTRDREAPGGLHERIVRGGSWYSRERMASHVSFRVPDPPCNAYWDLGFRIIVRSVRDPMASEGENEGIHDQS